jgi:hypothetical protein
MEAVPSVLALIPLLAPLARAQADALPADPRTNRAARAGGADAGDGRPGCEKLEAEDIADAIAYIVTRPRRVAVNEILIRPTEQEP